jgi:hypothetical protein
VVGKRGVVGGGAVFMISQKGHQRVAYRGGDVAGSRCTRRFVSEGSI